MYSEESREKLLDFMYKDACSFLDTCTDKSRKKGFFEVLAEYQTVLRKMRMEKPDRKIAFNTPTWLTICIFYILQ